MRGVVPEDEGEGAARRLRIRRAAAALRRRPGLMLLAVLPVLIVLTFPQSATLEIWIENTSARSDRIVLWIDGQVVYDDVPPTFWGILWTHHVTWYGFHSGCPSHRVTAVRIDPTYGMVGGVRNESLCPGETAKVEIQV